MSISSEVVQDRASNPGSEKHPNGCKPCNKYNRARPDSCKHGSSCAFCHCEHERPKHRGQRGRHALQRRQYLEAGIWDPNFKEMVDQVYKVPHDALEKLKLDMQRMSPEERKARVVLVLDKIREIGLEAQRSRPDAHRLQGARVTTEESTSPNLELDGRVKWLVGTLHLMIKKMWDAETPPDEIKQKVEDILVRCSQLPEVDREVHDEDYDQGHDLECIKKGLLQGGEDDKLDRTLSSLAKDDDGKAFRSDVLEVLEMTLDEEDKSNISNCTSLSELREEVGNVVKLKKSLQELCTALDFSAVQ